MLPINETIEFSQSPEAVAAMYADPQYAEIRKQELTADWATAYVNGTPEAGFTTTTEFAMPTDRAPQMVQSVIGSSVTVHEAQTWEAAGADGRREGRAEITVKGTPAVVSAHYRLEPSAGGSVLTVTGELSAQVPLVGKRIEKAAEPYVAQVFGVEQRAAQRYFAERED
ncbi:DUF2505 domain-containing protein [Helcobacillus sp. ACRRO]|uniref:DUF2505 domain-containing protein n=1 Tax=Helcobacillus sp. ACRRO TaxID=2918202 RepID=UPI001EF6065E|nr:DUF2505 domain-containing protein [Helcobacillus sp. ACRRO]MCG7426890.1 DUF2505 domain-containing protein [Helcobacillus sp. ACRRO]